MTNDKIFIILVFMNRFLKQILYGAFFIAVIAAVILLVVFWFFQPRASCSDGEQNQNEEAVDCGGPCVSCVLKNVQDLIVGPADVMPIGGKVTVAFDIRNPNGQLGIERLPYTIKLFDKDKQEIFSADRETFIYPNEQKPIVEAGIEVDWPRVKEARLLTDYDSDDWRDDFLAPAIELVDIRPSWEVEALALSGRVVNNNPFVVTNTAVTVIITNSLGLRVVVAKTVVGAVEPFSKKDFKVFLPLGGLNMSGGGQTEIKVEAKK